MISQVSFVSLVVVLVFCSRSSYSFATGGPGRGASPPTVDEKLKLDVGSKPVIQEDREASPFSCDVLYVGDAVVPRKSSGLCFDSKLTSAQARAIVAEAAVSKTVPKATLLEALHLLTYTSDQARFSGEGLIPAAAVDGVWRLCFSDGSELLRGVEVDRHGYVSRLQRVEVRFDTREERVVLGGEGLLDPSVPNIMKGALAYAPETETLSGMLQQGSMGSAPLALQICLVNEDALALRSVSSGNKKGYLLFQADRSRAAAKRLEREASPAPAEVAAKAAAAASVAGETKFELPLEIKIMRDEMTHETRRMEVEEKGRKAGSFNTFMRYLETEGGTLYAVIAGPVIFAFTRAYTPIAMAKVSAACLVIEAGLRHFLSLS